jgi:hypothetical protein
MESSNTTRPWQMRFSLWTLFFVTSLTAAFLAGHITPTNADRQAQVRLRELTADNERLSLQLRMEHAILESVTHQLKSAEQSAASFREGAVQRDLRSFRNRLLDPVAPPSRSQSSGKPQSHK